MQSRYAPGTMIVGRFRLEHPLGEGAYGEVWRATQLPVERAVAIKLLKPSNDHFARQRFDREARAMASISHPNCVTLFDFGHLPGDSGSFLVSEIVEGETLRTWMQRRPPLDAALDVCRQIVGALDAAHRQQVLHRDLKPENIMVRHDPQQGLVVKVLDFGLSKIVDDERRDITKTGEIFGTPGYMSPESLRGQEIGPGTDLYSFGVIMYELLEGRPPFVAQTGHEVCMMHLTQLVPPLVSAPPPLANLVMRLLEKDPRKRPSTTEVAQILGAPYQAPHQPQPRDHQPLPRPPALAETMLEGHVDPTGERDGLPRRALIAGAVVLLLLGLVATATMFSSPEASVEEAPLPDKPQRPSIIADNPPAVTSHDAGHRSVDVDSCTVRDGFHTLRHPEGTHSTHARLYIPPGYDPTKPTPIVLLLHEALQTADAFFDGGQFRERADLHGLPLVAPAGDPADLFSPWQTPESWNDAMTLTALAEEKLCGSDPQAREVYVFGYGSGGWAAESMVCEYPRITRIATHAHRLARNEVLCAPEVAVPDLFLAALQDGWDPVDGGGKGTCGGATKIPLAEHQRLLKKRHKCRGPQKSTREVAGGKCFTWSCETQLTECEIDGGRYWPGLLPPFDPCGGGRPSSAFPYDDVLWDFLTAD